MASTELARRIGQDIRLAVNTSGLGVRGVARRMGVVHETVYRWMRGEILPPLDKLDNLAEITGQSITIRLGDANEEPPPQWARALVAEVVEASQALTEGAVREAARQAAEAVLGQRQRTPGESAPGTRPRPPQGAGQTPGQ